VAPYKPGPQAHYLVDKRAESEKNIQDVLSWLTSQLASIEKKVGSMAVGLSKVQEKVDLAMTTISLVQEEQVLVANQSRARSSSSSALGGDGIMGPGLAAPSTASVGG
jgi:septation ring formation regulator EzrA